MLENRWKLIGVAVSGLLALVFVGAFLTNAWVVDDAYITFRVIDNLLHGRGLTWNPGERVQVFTHPLWMLLMSAAAALTGEFFLTNVGVSLLLCMAMLAVAHRWLSHGGDSWRPALLILLLLSSKAFMDYTSSGLENSLSYLLVALFCVQLGTGRDAPASLRHLAGLWLTASLAFVNRHDTLLLYLPTLAWVTWQSARALGWRIGVPLLLGSLPATAWLLFATLYYGFPLPNTWYAKVSTRLPLEDRLQRGFEYFANSLAWDSVSHLLVLGCLILALRRRRAAALLALAGVGLYYVFIVFHASATHMSGRFFAVPFCMALLWLAWLWPSPRWAVVVGAALIAYAVWNPIAPLKMGTRWYHAREQDKNRIDTSYLVHEAGPHVLLNHRGDWRTPDAAWYEAGLAFRHHPSKVHVGGAQGAEAIGFFGFAAGPEKIVVDYLGIADPLLARLPACNVGSPEHWKSGHFYRIPPKGYFESLARGENLIVDPGIHAYYDRLAVAVRDPDLLSWSRIETIVRLNLGSYDPLLDEPAERLKAALGGKDCRYFVAGLVGPFDPR